MKNPLPPVTKIDLAEAFEAYDGRNKLYRDEILTKLDRAMGELETIREDSVIGIHQMRELREEVDDHVKRIKVLEGRTQ